MALLESKLAELSETVGQYDLRRRLDQQLIQQLKDEVNGRLMDKIAANTNFGMNLFYLVNSLPKS